MAHSILVVEDDEELRPMLVSVLEDEGYEIEEASSGEKALKVARDKFFDLIITDVRMGGMDGLEMAEAIHRIQPDVPLIVVTGYAQDDAPIRAVRQGALDYLHKPFQLRVLLQCVEEALNNQLLLDNLARLTSALEKASSDSDVEEVRTRVYQKFYVAVRSQRLDKLEAFQAWEKLLDVESRRLSGESDYSEVEDFLDAAISKWAMPTGSAKISPDFHHLFEQIKDGKVSRHEITFAPLLKDLSPDSLFNAAPELVAIRKKLWG
jgi:CheY-like chemotaxis protein